MEKNYKVHIHVALLQYFQKATQKCVTKVTNLFLSAELVILVWTLW